MALYDRIGSHYARFRKPDPRIAASVSRALGDVGTIVNVGAGTGSYEPADRPVTAVEPSETMIQQRPAGSAICIKASAENLPFEDGAFEAAMTIMSLHHWADQERGLRELRRVAKGRIVILTWVPDGERFWLTQDYFPEIPGLDREIFPDTAGLVTMLKRTVGEATINTVPIPHDCTDGHLCAYWRRPEAYLEAGVRSAISSFAFFDAKAGLARLADDLASGRWARKNEPLL